MSVLKQQWAKNKKYANSLTNTFPYYKLVFLILEANCTQKYLFKFLQFLNCKNVSMSMLYNEKLKWLLG